MRLASVDIGELLLDVLALLSVERAGGGLEVPQTGGLGKAVEQVRQQ